MDTIVKFFYWQNKLTRKFDKLFPSRFRAIGNGIYKRKVIPSYFQKDLNVYDVGGGKMPYITAEVKKEYNFKYVGLDISKEELDAAPKGLYDETIVIDIAKFTRKDAADLIICQNVLEHVADVESTFEVFNNLLKKDGVLAIYVPSRNSLFARLNLILPQKLKERILFYVMPHTQEDQGFPAFYNKTTIKHFERFAEKHDLEILESYPYYQQSYFRFFLPLHMVWRIYIVIAELIFGKAAAVSFTMVFKKK